MPRFRARGRPRTQPVPGQMNKLETAYSEHLEQRRLAGEILSWKFDAVKFRLAKRTWYSPDFLVFDKDGYIELHETKGFMEDDAAVKIKVTAETFPWAKLFLIYRKTKKNGGGWDIRLIG